MKLSSSGYCENGVYVWIPADPEQVGKAGGCLMISAPNVSLTGFAGTPVLGLNCGAWALQSLPMASAKIKTTQ